MAGTSLDGSYIRPASGVIQAGVVCRGDESTGDKLSAVAGVPAPEYRDMKPRYVPPETCAGCAEPMAKRRRDGSPTPSGVVVHTAQGLCTICYKRMQSGVFDKPTVAKAAADRESASTLGGESETNSPDTSGRDAVGAIKSTTKGTVVHRSGAALPATG